jgi:hypothetical protein
VRTSSEFRRDTSCLVLASALTTYFRGHNSQDSFENGGCCAAARATIAARAARVPCTRKAAAIPGAALIYL